MSRWRWSVVLLWFATSVAAFAWSLIPARIQARHIRLEPVDCSQAVPTVGTQPISEPTSGPSRWTPPLNLHEALPSRLRLGAKEQVRLAVAAATRSSDCPSLVVTATLHADGAEVRPGGVISLPLTHPHPVHFDWSIATRQTGPTWLSLSLHLGCISADGELLGERLVWADTTPLTTHSWLGLPAPNARAAGLVSSLAAAAVVRQIVHRGRP